VGFGSYQDKIWSEVVEEMDWTAFVGERVCHCG
jgi:hypothetical protein